MGSVDKAAEGGHYYRNLRLHKESFCALGQFRVESLTAKYTDIDAGLITLFQDLKHNQSPSLNKEVVENAKFLELFNSITSSVDGTQSKMTIEYLKDVSSLLTLVSAVREQDIERRLQAERDTVKHCFAFDHVNYARYMSFQHVYLRDLERKSHPVKKMKLRGFGGSLSGTPFSNIHGDMITEVFNGGTKRISGPYRAGYSTESNALNTWIKTSHIHAKLQ